MHFKSYFEGKFINMEEAFRYSECHTTINIFRELLRLPLKSVQLIRDADSC